MVLAVVAVKVGGVTCKGGKHQHQRQHRGHIFLRHFGAEHTHDHQQKCQQNGNAHIAGVCIHQGNGNQGVHRQGGNNRHALANADLAQVLPGGCHNVCHDHTVGPHPAIGYIRKAIHAPAEYRDQQQRSGDQEHHPQRAVVFVLGKEQQADSRERHRVVAQEGQVAQLGLCGEQGGQEVAVVIRTIDPGAHIALGRAAVTHKGQHHRQQYHGTEHYAQQGTAGDLKELAHRSFAPVPETANQLIQRVQRRDDGQHIEKVKIADGGQKNNEDKQIRPLACQDLLHTQQQQGQKHHGQGKERMVRDDEQAVQGEHIHQRTDGHAAYPALLFHKAESTEGQPGQIQSQQG